MFIFKSGISVSAHVIGQRYPHFDAISHAVLLRKLVLPEDQRFTSPGPGPGPGLAIVEI